MTDKEILDTLDGLLDELDYRKILPNKQYKQMDKAFVYLEKILNEKEIENETTWKYFLVTNRNSNHYVTDDTNIKLWRILWLKDTTILKNYTNQY